MRKWSLDHCLVILMPAEIVLKYGLFILKATQKFKYLTRALFFVNNALFYRVVF